MKVSKEKRDEIRKSLVNAAVALAIEKGIAELSTREVAARAGVAPGTAYKYFPDCDQLVHTFFEFRFDAARATIAAIPGFADFTFKERLQAFLEAQLAEYEPDRQFVAMAFKSLLEAPLQAVGAMQVVKRKQTTLVEQFLEEAVENDELPEGTHGGFLARAFWDYTVVVVLYWLKDDTEGRARTSEFIDRSLDIYVALVRSGIVDSAARLFGFLVRHHLHDHFASLSDLVGGIGDALARQRKEEET
ncbi:MAG: TetR family transcriptional regulator [Polyangiaceae bacterium]